MKKAEVIKLMKEGTHCIYNDCPEKENQLKEILSYLQRSDYEGKLIVGQYYALSNDTPKIIWRGKILDIVYDVINLSEIEPDNEKPYLFYEGEKYYFGEEYEFSDDGDKWERNVLLAYYYHHKFPFKIDGSAISYIRKIDHTTKYKKLLLELKEQAEKDGVNLKEIL